MHNGDTLGRLAVFQGYFSAGGSAGIDQALEFHGGEHVIQAAITQLGDAGRVKILETGCQHDRSHGQIQEAIFHIMVDGTTLAGRQAFQAFRADPASQAALRF